eukprot:TRINITY_DN37875_c0_g1_i2.p1 TRINITY_DN37875_c0_g1~~TRINITY_DN37875_c0_g1_i2.p1  ORF type:complete len:273 (-),score=64.78 TRINITY_DN37875_c0_g1_i2:26-811(-)
MASSLSQSWAGPGSGGGNFEKVAAPLASELLATLEQEHTREVLALYEEQVRLREELRRVTNLMQREVLPRERQLHDMFERLSMAFHTSAQNLRQQHEDFHSRTKQISQQQDNSRRQLLDPLQEAESEVGRIESLLSKPLVASSGVPPQLLQQVQQRVLQSVQAGSAAQGRFAAANRPSTSAETCPSCGNVYMEDANFCRRCGAQRDMGVPSPVSPVRTSGPRSPGGMAGFSTPGSASYTGGYTANGAPPGVVRTSTAHYGK